MRILWMVVLSFLPLFAQAAEPVTCPLGEKETALTIQRVMINFGRYTRDAEAIAFHGRDPLKREEYTDVKVKESADKISVAIACAEAVLNNPTGDLVPSKLILVKDPKKVQSVIDDYVYFMGEFRDELTNFQAAFTTLLQQQPEARDWNALYEAQESFNKMVEHAHRKISFATSDAMRPPESETTPGQGQVWTSETPSTKDLMKQAEKHIKAIGKTVTDASKNAENAKAAGEAADLFKQTIDHRPEFIASLPKAQQDAAFAEYQEMMHKTVNLVLQLQEALSQNDNAKAKSLIEEIMNFKDEGHEKFNP